MPHNIHLGINGNLWYEINAARIVADWKTMRENYGYENGAAACIAASQNSGLSWWAGKLVAISPRPQAEALDQ